MSLLENLERLITERGSSAILKERIDLIREQIAALERKNTQLVESLKLAEAKAVVLEAENKELRNQLKAHERNDEKLGDATVTVLRFLFERGDEASADFAAYELRQPESVVEHHFDILRQRGFIRQSGRYMRTADIAPGGPAFRLTPEGRAFYMQLTAG
ncbi:MAG: hypothetical protein JWM88_1134 [Verrucomicrobia bacterium]|nr:hypothetical protein [Verrucomicrobiota bacterium]